MMVRVGGRLMLIKALSLHEPFASLIAQRSKTIETRTWPTKHRGPLLICAAKKNDRHVKDVIANFQSSRFCQAHWCRVPLLDEDFEPQLGKAVAICNVVDCRPLEGRWSLESCVPNTNGLYGMFLENIKAIEPFDVKGGQRFFYVEVASKEILDDFEDV